MAASEPDDSFPIVIAVSLWIRDPLFVAQSAITVSKLIHYVTTDTKYSELSTEISKLIEIEKQQVTAWKVIDWTRYSMMPLQIWSRLFQHGGNRPIEMPIDNDRDLEDALKFIEIDERGSHLGVNVTIYEGDVPPEEDSPGMIDEGVEMSAYRDRDCDVCGFVHGFGECRAMNGGIQVESLGSGDGGWGS